MPSSFTTNKGLEKPANGEYVDTWNVPVNADMDVIDQAFGGTTTLNATAGSAVLTSTQYRSLILKITGAISADVTYTIPSGIGGEWIVANSTTDASGGPWAVIVNSGGGGTSVTIPRLQRLIIVSDGTNISALNYVGTTSAGDASVSNDLSVGGKITATGDITGSAKVSDAIGNLREVPVNSQTTGYTLQASDNGKFISITTGGVTVPSGVFAVNQIVSIYNNSASDQTITQGSGTTLRLVGTTTTGSRTLSSYGLATVLCVGSNVFLVTGGGVS